MRDLLGRRSLTDLQAAVPDDHGQWVAEAGWVVGPSGALLLRALWNGGREVLDNPDLVAGFEYEVNDVYLSLSDLTDDMDEYLLNAASRGLLFAAHMLQEACWLPGCDRLEALVHVFVDREDEGFLLQGARNRFFTKRGGYPDWLDDLGRFKLEATAVLDMADVKGLDIALQLG